MPLTLDQAAQAGTLAGYIIKANEAIASFDNRIANSKDVIRISADLANGDTIREDLPLSAQEMVGVYEYLKNIVVTKRDALQAQLDGITIEN